MAMPPLLFNFIAYIRLVCRGKSAIKWAKRRVKKIVMITVPGNKNKPAMAADTADYREHNIEPAAIL
jgi:hypothetical protein